MVEHAPGFGIYIHWPFCAAKCPYCDFNSHVSASIDQEAWRAALLQDLRSQADLFDKHPVTSVFFGGGTPSLMPASTVGALIEEISSLWSTSRDVEITLEANPTSVEASRLADFAAAGVNRLSMGVQSLRDEDLKRLGRLHTAEEARAAFYTARQIFPRVSFDLIYARQDQSERDWTIELTEALAVGADHMSLYQLTIEPGTAFGALYEKGRLHGLPADERSAALYDITQELCETAGLHAYEISNHARPGFECRHNLSYWHYDPYLGIGPGAHGRPSRGTSRFETSGHLAPGVWLETVASDGHGLELCQPLTPRACAQEAALMGLRLRDGIDPDQICRFDPEILDWDAIHELTRDGHLVQSNKDLKISEKSKIILNSIIEKIIF